MSARHISREGFIRSNLVALPNLLCTEAEPCPICRKGYHHQHTPMQITGIRGCDHIVGFHCMVGRCVSKDKNANLCPVCNRILFAFVDVDVRATSRTSAKQGPSKAAMSKVPGATGVSHGCLEDDPSITGAAVLPPTSAREARDMQERLSQREDCTRPDALASSPQLHGAFSPMDIDSIDLTVTEPRDPWSQYADVQNAISIRISSLRSKGPSKLKQPDYSDSEFADLSQPTIDLFDRTMRRVFTPWISKVIRVLTKYERLGSVYKYEFWETHLRRELGWAPWEDKTILLGRQPTKEEFEWIVRRTMAFIGEQLKTYDISNVKYEEKQDKKKRKWTEC